MLKVLRLKTRPRLLLAASLAQSFLTKQWKDIFYWCRARIEHSILMLRCPADLTDHQLMSLLFWHSHQTEKATKHRSDISATKPRGNRHYSNLQLLLEEGEGRPHLLSTEASALAWAKDIHDSYVGWATEDKSIKIVKPSLAAVCKETVVAPENLDELMMNCTSTRVWQPREVPDDVIDRITDCALHAPSSCNRQGVVLVNVKRSFPRELEEGVNNKFMLNNAPLVIYICCDPSLYPERIAPALDAGMAAQNVMLLAETFGLKSCPMYHCESFDQNILRSRLGITKNLYTYVALLVGYPDERAVKPKRLSTQMRSKLIRE